MTRRSHAVAAALLLASLSLPRFAVAHFVFIVPGAAGKAHVVMSETLTPDGDVNVSIIAGTRVFARDVAGKDSAALALTPGKNVLEVGLTDDKARLLYGKADLGINQHGGGPANILVYHPKTIVGDPYTAPALGAEITPVELEVIGAPGQTRLKLVAAGKPLAKTEFTVILPDGTDQKVTTDERGLTTPFTQTGRFAAWARYLEDAPGERDGKPYVQVRHYATLVIDVPAAGEAHAGEKAEATVSASIARFTTMPYAASSFGAVACEGYLYVYGGHIVPTHSYSTEAVTGRFARLRLDGGTTWEELPPGPPCQGMNLAAANGKVYRAGGMQPRNKPSDPADNHSLAEAAVFDPASKTWSALPALPVGRSSHDLVVAGGKLIALGGWSMTGKEGENKWLDGAAQLDLANPAAWQPLAEPFQRRALIAYPHAGKVYVIGGFDENDEASKAVEVLDVASHTWAKGPEIPGKQFNGFSPAACELNGKLYLSVGDGSLYRLDRAGKAWEKVAQSTPRIVHRMVPAGDRLLIVGGATSGKNLDLIESYRPAE